MSAFSKVIGYNKIKERLLQICDMIKNPEIYEAAGAKFPGGIILYGDPGMGKSLMARCFIEECGVSSYTICRTVGDGDFLKKIADTFEEAKQAAPSVIHLEDLDKFANEDDNHKDAEEYVAVQAAIDSVRGQRVMVIATVNDRYKLPDSLIRAGRFDISLTVMTPNREEAAQIIRYYLSDKPFAPDTNISDISHMIQYSSCAELETILNNAAIHAAANRRKELTTDDFVKAIFDILDEFAEEEYDPEADNDDHSTEKRKVAYHEAGHLVISEILKKGSVGYARIIRRPNGDYKGEVKAYLAQGQSENRILIALAGKAAVEMIYPGEYAEGCWNDLADSGRKMLWDMMSEDGFYCISLLNTEPNNRVHAESYLTRLESSVHLELERLLMKTKRILNGHRAFLERTAGELMKKDLLLASDIRRIYEETENVKRAG